MPRSEHVRADLKYPFSRLIHCSRIIHFEFGDGESTMNTYIAKIETPAGTQTIRLAAADIQDAQEQMVARAPSATSQSFSYSIAKVSPIEAPQFLNGLTSASVALVVCLILFGVMDSMLRKWLRS